MKPKKAETFRSWEIAFPNDANPLGTLFGGRLMAIMDKMAAIAATRYAEKPTVTASTEAMDFKVPVRVGDRIQTFARVVWVGHTSMVVKVDVYAERPYHFQRFHCTTAYFNFVAVDREGRPSPVPPLLIETPEEEREFRIAEIVKKKALERKKKIEETR
ncbi:MAG: acyl-CoA thioesterase [Calditrichaeota bacterium]|nr:MAG: acyl-CoA thioesterase [Calditrichota bacterium]